MTVQGTNYTERVGHVGTLAATAVVRCTFTKLTMRMWAVLNSVKDKAFMSAMPFTIHRGVYWCSFSHIAYFMTYFWRWCFANVCSYNRDTHCSEVRSSFKDGRATHLVCGSVSCVSSCSGRPLSSSDQCLLTRMLCVYTWSAPPSNPPWLAVTSCTIEFPVGVTCKLA